MRKIFATIEESVWNSHLHNIATKMDILMFETAFAVLCCYVAAFVRLDGNMYITSQLNSSFLHFCCTASYRVCIHNFKSDHPLLLLCVCRHEDEL